MNDLSRVGMLGVAAAAAVSWAACASPTSSTLRGQVELQTFAAPVTGVVAAARDGASIRVSVGADGGFEIVLDKEKTYRIALQTEAGEIPLVFDGAHGVYVTSLAVPSGGAEAHIGRLRYFANMSARSADFVGDSDAAATCVDGVFEGSAEPCIGGAAVQICVDDDGDSDSDSDDRRDRGESDRDHHRHDDAKARTRRGQRVRGAVAVPEHSLTSLGCHDDDGDSDSND